MGVHPAAPEPKEPARSAQARENLKSGRKGVVGWLLGPAGALAGCPVTRLLIAVNAVIFVGEVLSARTAVALSAVPEPTMLAFGGNYTPFVVGEGRLEALVASCFLHFSILHLGFNLYALRQVGPFVERAVGSARFLPMYLASGILGSAASSLVGWLGNPERLSAGASGAICGVIGAALVLGGRTQGWRGPIVRAMGFWLAATFVLGMTIGADNSAHAGGALCGGIVALVWRRGVVYGAATQRMIVLVCTAILVASAIAVVARDVLDPYAALDVDARTDRAIRAFDGGDCAEAARAIDRAVRLAPRAEHARRLQQLRQKVERYCTRT